MDDEAEQEDDDDDDGGDGEKEEEKDGEDDELKLVLEDDGEKLGYEDIVVTEIIGADHICIYVAYSKSADKRYVAD